MRLCRIADEVRCEATRGDLFPPAPRLQVRFFLGAEARVGLRLLGLCPGFTKALQASTHSFIAA